MKPKKRKFQLEMERNVKEQRERNQKEQEDARNAQEQKQREQDLKDQEKERSRAIERERIKTSPFGGWKYSDDYDLEKNLKPAKTLILETMEGMFFKNSHGSTIADMAISNEMHSHEALLNRGKNLLNTIVAVILKNSARGELANHFTICPEDVNYKTGITRNHISTPTSNTEYWLLAERFDLALAEFLHYNNISCTITRQIVKGYDFKNHWEIPYDCLLVNYKIVEYKKRPRRKLDLPPSYDVAVQN